MRSFVDLKFDHFFVCVDKVLIVVLVFKSIVKREFANVSSLLDFLMNLSEKVTYFFYAGPKVRL